MAKQQKDMELINALKEFKKSYIHLVEVIRDTNSDGNDTDGHRFDSIAGWHYPFSESFDELAISDWVDQSIENLKRR